MNTSYSNLEPRWATYFKAAAFTIPAVFFWVFSTMFLLPKLNEICQSAGTTVFNFGQAPVVFRAFATVGQIMILLTHHGMIISGAIILMFILLEARLKQWPRYRRAVMGLGAFLLNAVVLISITMMVISAVIAAPALAHHVK